ncbi:transferase [Krasilnikovia sp. MM14-A1259]
MDALFAEGFPAFITADQEVKKYIGLVREYFPHLDVMLVDDEKGEPVATGWGVPISWSGEVENLPVSFADVLRRAVEVHQTGSGADTFVICGGIVHPGRKGTGVAEELITSLCGTAETHGLLRVLAPVRPTRKHQYPLFSIEEYASWSRPDGLPFDPWLRLHARLGANVIAMAPEAQTMTATVGEWEKWAGLAMPASGEYVIPQGMSVLRLDRDADLGTYVEPNVWVRHR